VLLRALLTRLLQLDVVAHALRTLAAAVEPGISTAELDAIAEREIRSAGAVPSFMATAG